ALFERLRVAVRLVLAAQGADGGWRYTPEPAPAADLSVTAAQMVALRAARNVGLVVPKTAMVRALDFVRTCQLLPEGGFCYQPRAGRPSFAMTAAGLAALHAAGIYTGQPVDAARAFLLPFRPGAKPPPALNSEYLLYGHYYAAQALHQAESRL